MLTIQINHDHVTYESKIWSIYMWIIIYFLFVQIFLHDCTVVEPYPLLFFGGKLETQDDEGSHVISMDGIVKFHAPPRIAQLIQVSVLHSSTSVQWRKCICRWLTQHLHASTVFFECVDAYSPACLDHMLNNEMRLLEYALMTLHRNR